MSTLYQLIGQTLVARQLDERGALVPLWNMAVPGVVFTKEVVPMHNSGVPQPCGRHWGTRILT